LARSHKTAPGSILNDKHAGDMMTTQFSRGGRAVTVAGSIGAFLLAGMALVSAQGGGPRFSPDPSTQDAKRLVTLDTLKRWEKELSNWGRWGKDDQRGLLNLITPDKTKSALGLVKEAKTVTLQINPIKKTGSDTGGFGENLHRMARVHPVTGAIQGALDVIHLSIHDGLSSHMDALCHYQGPIGRKDGEPAVSYNGFPFTLTAAGCIESAADRMGPGYITRGILVDLPLMKGVKWLEPSTPVYAEDLEAWEKFAGIRIGAGDALIVRTGRWAKRAAEGPWPYGQAGAGLHASVLPWLKSRDVSLLASDAVNDVQPSGVQGINRPIHQLTQVNMGLPLVDNAYTEDAAVEAARLKRWEFMLTLQIYQIQGGTASPFNALATF
jgi:hypothetical protein